MALFTLLARASDGLPLSASIQDDDHVLIKIYCDTLTLIFFSPWICPNIKPEQRKFSGASPHSLLLAVASIVSH